jgi:hypothetical protein
MRPFVERVMASRGSCVRKRTPVFFDTPAVMESEPMEVRVDVDRVLAALSDDRCLACLLVDHMTGLCCFVGGW